MNQINNIQQDKTALIEAGYTLVFRSGLAAAALYGLGQAINQSSFLESQPFILVALKQAVSVAAWLVPLVFAGVGVNVLSTGLTMPKATGSSSVEIWSSALPTRLHGFMRWLAKKLS
ncbi:hypothetical protein INQ40_00660 [Lysobacter sp. H21R4]|nr:hypothetical protein INQ40_00660 [Lysobacter sp. H21R4]